jgi:hypothetical protein
MNSALVLKPGFIPGSLLFLSSRPRELGGVSSSSKSINRLVSTSCHVCLVLVSTDSATSVYNKQCCKLCPIVRTFFHPEVSSSSCHFLTALMAVSSGGILSHLVYVYLTCGPVTWGWPQIAPIYKVTLSQHRWLNLIGQKKAPPHLNLSQGQNLSSTSGQPELS